MFYLCFRSRLFCFFLRLRSYSLFSLLFKAVFDRLKGEEASRVFIARGCRSSQARRSLGP